MPRLSPGETVDRYVIERVLGDGGMAVVYLARHAHLGSHHALKVLSAELLGDPGIRERFLAEGRIQAQLGHPNIARVTDVVSEPGIAALVIEYVEGPNLDEWLEGREALPPSELLPIFGPVLDAVEAAHARGILHRDLKPSNILLGKGPGGAVRPVVLDFGIAGITDGADLKHGRQRRTRTGTQLGTPAYMSPEQVRNRGELDGRTDIFSLGAILYELATGRIAFEAESDFDTLSNVVSGTYQGPDDVPGDAAGLVGQCIQKALAVDRDERYPDVASFRAALVQAVGATQLRASGPPSVEPLENVAVEEPDQVAWASQVTEERPRRRRWPLRLLLLLVLVGTGWAASLGVTAVRAQARQDATRRAETESRALAGAAMATLARRQTDAVANADDSVLDRAVAQARDALAAAPTPEAHGALALALVLHDGWHLRGRTWDEAAFATVEQATRSAFVGPTRPETALARAIVEARACRLLSGDDPRRAGFCRDALARFVELDGALRRDTRDWLRVEVGWMAAGFLDALAKDDEVAGIDQGASDLLDQAVQLCGSARSSHGKGAVNDHVLRGVCLGVAGRAGALREYFAWARAIRAADEAAVGKLLDEHTELIFQSVGSPACWALPLSRANSWGRPLPDPRDAAERWCAAVGLYALDCPGEARVQVLAGKLSSMMGGEDRPWASPELAWSRQGAAPCYLEPGR